MFLTFSSQEERRTQGGSDFIELQYCRLKGVPMQEIVAVDAIKHWENDSLYIPGDDMDVFFTQYSGIFREGLYHNGQWGVMDLFGINYYPSKQTARIIERVKKELPNGYPTLLHWLGHASTCNGFYLLGL